jgi:carbamoyl-phosphate synthase large subunit
MATLSVIRSIRAHFPQFCIIGTDTHDGSIVYVRSILDRFYTVPEWSDLAYIEVLIGIVEQEGVDLIIPLTDVEVDVLSLHRRLFEFVGATVCVSPGESILRCRDKRSVGNWFENHEAVRVPRIYETEEIEAQHVAFPLVSKPVKGRSSQGLRIYHSHEELPRTLDDQAVYQQYIEGEIYTVDVVRDTRGQVVALPRLELVRTANGAGVTVSVQPDRSELIALSESVVHAMDLIGAVNLEFIHDGMDYYLIDINPRFSAGVGFSIASGFEVVKHHIDVFMGNPITPDSQPFAQQVLTKVYEDHIL